MSADPPPPGPPVAGAARSAWRRSRTPIPTWTPSCRRTPSGSGPAADPSPVAGRRPSRGARRRDRRPAPAQRRRARGRGRRAVLGGDGRAGSACRSWSPCTACRRRRRAPAERRRGRYHAHLEAVLATAEVVLTLTPGAADEIADRFGRTAIVVAHPSAAVPDPGARRRARARRTAPRAAGAGRPRRRALVRAALSGAVSGGGRLRVLTDDERHVGRAVRELADRGDLELVVHPAAERPAQLQQLHVAVLPEPRGTHSHDLEICRDVGTLVVAPSCGWSADQWSEVVSYGNRRERLARPALAHRGGRRGPDPADAAAGRPGLAGRAAGRRPGGARGRLPAGGRRPRVGLSARHARGAGRWPPGAGASRTCGRRPPDRRRR